MRRYTIEAEEEDLGEPGGAYLVYEEDKNGEWVKWKDVEPIVRRAFEMALDASEHARQARIVADKVSSKLCLFM